MESNLKMVLSQLEPIIKKAGELLLGYLQNVISLNSFSHLYQVQPLLAKNLDIMMVPMIIVG
jgi:hypothetical protein